MVTESTSRSISSENEPFSLDYEKLLAAVTELNIMAQGDAAADVSPHVGLPEVTFCLCHFLRWQDILSSSCVSSQKDPLPSLSLMSTIRVAFRVSLCQQQISELLFAPPDFYSFFSYVSSEGRTSATSFFFPPRCFLHTFMEVFPLQITLQPSLLYEKCQAEYVNIYLYYGYVFNLLSYVASSRAVRTHIFRI